MRFYFMLHPSLVRLACIPPPRLSSLLKKDTLVALLDGTADSAPSQPVAAETLAQLPVTLKRFKNLAQRPKLIDKMLAAMDPHKFTPDVLDDKLWKDGAKLGVVYMYLKQSPESDMPRVYILELKFEAAFLSAASQLSNRCRAAAKLPVDALKKGFYRAKGCKVEWAWRDGDEGERGEIPTLCFEDTGKTVAVEDPFDIDSVAIVTTAKGRMVKTEPLRELFEQEGVDFEKFGQKFELDGGTYIMSPSAKRKASRMSPKSSSPRKKHKGKKKLIELAAGNVSDALMRKLAPAAGRSSSSRPSAAAVFGGE